jgi:membrane protease YdiL (CAAX protease family)
LSESRPDQGPTGPVAPRGVFERPVVPGHRVFFGPVGLRAGWAILLFASLCAVLVIVGGLAVAPFLHFEYGAPIAPRASFLIELSQLVPVALATLAMALLEQRSPLSYGFQGRARGVRLLSGAASGFLALSVLVVVLHGLGNLAFEGDTLGGLAALRYALEWGLVFVCVGFCEEAMFRGYAQFAAARGLGFWWGALLLCVPFALMHASNPGESPAGLADAAAVSLLFCLSLWYTGSLWWAVGFHAAWDWAQSYFYGTADSGMQSRGHLFASHPVGRPLLSGGTTGPEGSVLVMPLLLMMALLMAAWWGKRGEKPFRGTAWRGAAAAALEAGQETTP